MKKISQNGCFLPFRTIFLDIPYQQGVPIFGHALPANKVFLFLGIPYHKGVPNFDLTLHMSGINFLVYLFLTLLVTLFSILIFQKGNPLGCLLNFFKVPSFFGIFFTKILDSRGDGSPIPPCGNLWAGVFGAIVPSPKPEGLFNPYWAIVSNMIQSLCVLCVQIWPITSKSCLRFLKVKILVAL